MAESVTHSPTHQLTAVMRRRRDGAAGAPSSGSRVSPLPIAPCPRRPTALHGVAVLLFFPDHRLSNSAFIRIDALGVEPSIRLHRIPMMRRETPHLAHGAGGASSYRSVPGFARRARALPPTTWILHHFPLCRAVGCPTCSSSPTCLRFASARPASCATDRAHVASSRRSRRHTYRPPRRTRRRARTSSR